MTILHKTEVSLIEKIQNREATICILGLGYIGLPIAAMFATHGFEVIGVDVKEDVLDSLNNGKVHIKETGLQELVNAAQEKGNLVVRSQPEPADVFIIAVPTPITEEKKADMRFVDSATGSIIPNLKKGNLVILESTSPPRTTVDRVAPILGRSGLRAGEDFMLAYSPERVLPGKILKELVHNARIIGGMDQTSAEAGKQLYASFVQGEIHLTDSITAEMVKLMENTYRDVNIALANEFSRIAEHVGLDVWDAIELANMHPRVDILSPGPGVGGHCISVDPWFLVEAAPEATHLIHQARRVNDSQPQYVVGIIEKALGGSVKGKRIAALGLAYKPDVDDLRESPAVKVANTLAQAGAHVIVYEPYTVRMQFDEFKLAPTLDDAINNVDAIVLLVRHQQFINLIPDQILGCTNAGIVIDTVNGWSKKDWVRAGFMFWGLGL